MKITRTGKLIFVVALLCAMALTTTVSRAADPLPSWNDSRTKKAIVDFVDKVTTNRLAGFCAGAGTHRHV